MTNSYVNSNIKPIEKILQVAKNPKPIKPNEWMVQCPNHQDDKASLHVTEDISNGKVLLRCHAGCNNRDIVQAWGLGMKDLFPPREHPPDMPQQPNRPQTVAVYNYTDVGGNLIYQVVRQRQSNGNKGFYQRRPDGHGGWINNMNGVIPVPYQLPRLIKTLKEGHVVLIVEGEKDVDKLVKFGLVATCNSGGAGKWSENYSKCFPVGAKAVILPDNDEPGRKHARDIARQLQARECQVRIIELPGLPEKGDVSDWLDAGHDKGELIRLITEAWETEQEPEQAELEPAEPTWKPVITCLADVVEEEVMWLWERYIALRKLCLIEGDPSHGKTWFSLFLAAAVSRGWKLPDPDTGGFERSKEREPANVIYMTAEDGLADTIKPRLSMLGADHNRIYVIEGQRNGDDDMEPVSMQDVDILRQAMKDIRPTLLIIDPLQGFLGSGVDMNKANQTRPVLSGMLRLAEEFNCAVVIIRHLNKSNIGKAAYRGIGSIDFTAAARTVLLVGKDPEDDHKRVVVPTKCNIGIEGVPVVFELNEFGFVWAGKTDKTADELLYPEQRGDDSKEDGSLVDKVVVFLQEALQDGPVAFSKLSRDAGKLHGASDKTLRRAKEKLNIEAFKGQGAKGAWYWKLVEKDGQKYELDHLTKPSQTTDTPSLNKDGQDGQVKCIREAVHLTNTAQKDGQMFSSDHLTDATESPNGPQLEQRFKDGQAKLSDHLTNVPWTELGHEINLPSREGGQR